MNPCNIPPEDYILQHGSIMMHLDSMNNDIFELWAFVSGTMGRPAHDPLMENLVRLKKELENVRESFDVVFSWNVAGNMWGEPGR